MHTPYLDLPIDEIVAEYGDEIFNFKRRLTEANIDLADIIYLHPRRSLSKPVPVNIFGLNCII